MIQIAALAENGRSWRPGKSLNGASRNAAVIDRRPLRLINSRRQRRLEPWHDDPKSAGLTSLTSIWVLSASSMMSRNELRALGLISLTRRKLTSTVGAREVEL